MTFSGLRIRVGDTRGRGTDGAVLMGGSPVMLCSPLVVVVTGCAAVAQNREVADGKCLCGVLLSGVCVGGRLIGVHDGPILYCMTH